MYHLEVGQAYFFELESCPGFYFLSLGLNGALGQCTMSLHSGPGFGSSLISLFRNGEKKARASNWSQL